MGRGTSGGECYGEYTSSSVGGSGAGYVNACIHSGSNSYTSGNTVWYNYGTASAGTIIDTSSTSKANNTNVATESICPKGWSLPTTEQLSNNTNISAFSPTMGGSYGNGLLSDETTRGDWWSSIVSNSATRSTLRYKDDALLISRLTRYSGAYIRCVSEEKDVSDLTYMQDMTAKVVTNPKGWTLPSETQIDSFGGDSPGSDIYIPSFSPILGGYYTQSLLKNTTTSGHWWGSMAYEGYGGTIRYRLNYDGSNLYTGSNVRYNGLYVRCIQAS